MPELETARISTIALASLALARKSSICLCSNAAFSLGVIGGNSCGVQAKAVDGAVVNAATTNNITTVIFEYLATAFLV